MRDNRSINHYVTFLVYEQHVKYMRKRMLYPRKRERAGNTAWRMRESHARK